MSTGIDSDLTAFNSQPPLYFGTAQNLGTSIELSARLAQEQELSENDFIHSRVMILDDEQAITQMLAHQLKLQGFDSFCTFNSPAAAIEHLQAHPQDLLMLDIRMPKIDGLKILKFLRSKPETRYLPIIVLTSVIDQQTRLAALNAGASDFLIKPVDPDELFARIRNALEFKGYVARIEASAKLARQELERDTMTDLQNRRAFDNYLSNEFKQGHVTDLGLILFDIDQFKEVNDEIGHRAGDAVLRSIGSVVDICCGPLEFASRIGGDEFGILCHHKNPQRTIDLAEQIREIVSEAPIAFEEQAIQVSISVGIVNHDASTGTKEILFDRADAGLYKAKRLGGNRCVHFKQLPQTGIKRQMVEQRGHATHASNINPFTGRILLVDDEPSITQILQAQLNRAGYQNVEMQNDATQAIDHCKRMVPDLIIMDVRMPNVNGLQLLSQLKELPEFASIPVLIMTSSNDSRIRIAALKLKANDFLTKPTNAAELAVRVQNALLIKFQHDQLKQISSQLRFEVEVRTQELFSTRREAILSLARTAESRDTETGRHVIRVGRYAAIIGRSYGLDENFVSWLELAAQLHDVGKIAIPDSILYKPTALTDEEFAVMKTHCLESRRILGNEKNGECGSPLLQMAARIALTHHERWDGDGYPHKIAGEEIPIEGRITAVADVFDAISSKRHYKEAFNLERCFDILIEGSESHFDPKVLAAFFNAKDEIVVAMHELQD